MPAPISRLVLLPGFDGTSTLFKDFVSALGADFQSAWVRYPADDCLSYEELMPLVLPIMPVSEPFVLVAESFSTPIAIRYAAMKPPNLKGVVLCAGFARSPLRGWVRSAVRLLAPVLFRMGLPGFAARFLLIGYGAPSSLLSEVRAAVASVSPKVLGTRLRAVMACDVRADLAKIEVPLLYLRAKQDHLVGKRCFAEIRRIKVDAQKAGVSGPHLLLQRKPKEAAEIVGNFVRHLTL
jgi:pimeloyl-[acyl-carrier protein] methyl ester esterase